MKKCTSILIFFCLLSQCVLQLGVIGWYEMNKEYVAKNLCENRDKPQMKCCGKCYLRKQLNKAGADNNSNKNVPNKIEKSEVMAYIIPSAFSFMPASAFPEQAVNNPAGQDLRDVRATLTIFHPPSLAV